LIDPKSSGNQPEYLSHGGRFIKAYEAGELEIVKAMVERAQGELEATDESGWTPLYFATDSSHLPAVQYLYEQGADIGVCDMGGDTPLHYVSVKGHLPAVQYLCDQGADKEARSVSDRTPLLLATHYSHPPVMQYLCRRWLKRKEICSKRRFKSRHVHSRGRTPQA